MSQLIGHSYYRALEVACGQGKLTKDLLDEKYDQVDMFDRSSAAVEEAKDNTLSCESVIMTDTCSM